MAKVAFFTVICPATRNYLGDFLSSLEQQTYKEFDLYLFSDGVEKEECDLDQAMNIIWIESSGSPLSIRVQGLKHLLEKGYEIIIFGDSDDYFLTNRVEKAVELLSLYDIVINDVDLVDETGQIDVQGYFSSRLEDKQLISIDDIKDKNIFGLTNTAIRTTFLSEINLDPSLELIAVDWHLFSCLLLSGAKAVFTRETKSFYRQYNRNVIGINKLNEQIVLKGLRAKMFHYKNLSRFVSDFSYQYEKIKLTYDNLCHNKSFLLAYVEKIKKIGLLNPFWWEQIKSLEDLNENKVN